MGPRLEPAKNRWRWSHVPGWQCPPARWIAALRDSPVCLTLVCYPNGPSQQQSQTPKQGSRKGVGQKSCRPGGQDRGEACCPRKWEQPPAAGPTRTPDAKARPSPAPWPALCVAHGVGDAPPTLGVVWRSARRESAAPSRLATARRSKERMAQSSQRASARWPRPDFHLPSRKGGEFSRRDRREGPR